MKAFRRFSWKCKHRFYTVDRARKLNKTHVFLFVFYFSCFVVVFRENWPTKQTQLLFDGGLLAYPSRPNSVSSLFSTITFPFLGATVDLNQLRQHPRLGPHLELLIKEIRIPILRLSHFISFYFITHFSNWLHAVVIFDCRIGVHNAVLFDAKR